MKDSFALAVILVVFFVLVVFYGVRAAYDNKNIASTLNCVTQEGVIGYRDYTYSTPDLNNWACNPGGN